MDPILFNEAEAIRMECLKMASRNGGNTDTVIQRATAFYHFVTGQERERAGEAA